MIAPENYDAELNSIRDRCPRVWSAFEEQKAGALKKDAFDNVTCVLCNTGRLGLARYLLNSLPVEKDKHFYKRSRVFDDYALDVPEKRRHVSCLEMGCDEEHIRKCFGDDLHIGPERLSPELKLRMTDREKAARGLFYEMKKDSNRKVFDRSRFKAESFAKALLAGIYLGYNEELDRYYLFTSGYWQMLPAKTTIIKRLIHKQFDRIAPNEWTPGLQKACLDAIEVLCIQTSSLKSANRYLCLKNGMLDLELKEKFVLVRHTPEVFCTSQTPIRLNREAKCPQFLQVMSDFFMGDVEMIVLAQRVVGCCLGPTSKAGKMFLFLGEASTGKSLFCEILADVVGRQNVSNLELKKFAGQFGPFQIVGKNLNLSSEFDNHGRFPVDIENLKKIITGDTLTVEAKGKTGYSYKPHVKIACACNHLPNVDEASDEFRRRVLIMKFEQRFVDEPHEGEKQRNPYLYEQLQSELEGILVWGLEGLYDLMKDNYKFPHAAKSDACMKQYAEYLDTFLRFTNENLVPEPAGKVNMTDLRELFEEWCTGEGISDYRYISAQRFWRNLEPVLNLKKDREGVSYEKRLARGGRVHLIGYRLADNALGTPEYAIGDEDELFTDLMPGLNVLGASENMAMPLRETVDQFPIMHDDPAPLDGEEDPGENAEVSADSEASSAPQKAKGHDETSAPQEDSEPQAPAKKPKRGRKPGKKHPKSND
ncbi:phage/plasmid primase, P4 family [Pyramidobacter sp.]|uniref:phage/plasmid primase, P4 family n=1 Tax=Pyramidobacter sp. TaxID=1943581 RepID=UPI00332CD76D